MPQGPAEKMSISVHRYILFACVPALRQESLCKNMPICLAGILRLPSLLHRGMGISGLLSKGCSAPGAP